MKTKQYKFESVCLGGFFSLKGEEGFVLDWKVKGIGFGEISFCKYKNKVVCETECMPKAFIKQAVEFWLKSLEYKDI